MKKLFSAKGFTLLEMITVLVIVGIILAVSVPGIIGMSDSASARNCGELLGIIEKRIESAAVTERYADQDEFSNKIETVMNTYYRRNATYFKEADGSCSINGKVSKYYSNDDETFTASWSFSENKVTVSLSCDIHPSDNFTATYAVDYIGDYKISYENADSVKEAIDLLFNTEYTKVNDNGNEYSYFVFYVNEKKYVLGSCNSIGNFKKYIDETEDNVEAIIENNNGKITAEKDREIIVDYINALVDGITVIKIKSFTIDENGKPIYVCYVIEQDGEKVEMEINW